MLRALKPPRASVPNLVIAQRVLDKMKAVSTRYLDAETGEAMIGLVVSGERTNGVPTLYVLDTISPDESAIRQIHTFQQGDELQFELFDWLNRNWEYARQRKDSGGSGKFQDKWDVPLRHLGDWHRQPGFMIEPSSGDLMTALDMLADPENNFDFLLAPIITLGHSSSSELNGAVNYLTVPCEDGTLLRADFWYIDQNTRGFQPIVPVVYPNDQLPVLAAYPWHLVNESRMSDEYQKMQDDALFTTVILWEANDTPPLEVCFMTARMGADRIVIVCTPWDYPKQGPSARIAPFIQMGADDDMFEVFERLWEKSAPLADPSDWEWSEERSLLEYIHALELAHDLRVSPVVNAEASAMDTAADENEDAEDNTTLSKEEEV